MTWNFPVAGRADACREVSYALLPLPFFAENYPVIKRVKVTLSCTYCVCILCDSFVMYCYRNVVRAAPLLVLLCS